MTKRADLRLNGMTEFTATSVEIEPITIDGTDWFESHFGQGVVSVIVPKTVAAFEVEPLLRELGLGWTS